MPLSVFPCSFCPTKAGAVDSREGCNMSGGGDGEKLGPKTTFVEAAFEATGCRSKIGRRYVYFYAS